MGALVTLDLSADSPTLTLPWIITFGPLSDEEEWEPVVCGPYERPHALALAEAVVADEEIMAVVEPLQPHVAVDQIRGDIAAARLAEQEAADAGDEAGDHDHDEDDDEAEYEPSEPPSPEEVRAGIARIAAQLGG